MDSRKSRLNFLALSLASFLGLTIVGTPLFALAEDNLPDVGLPGRRVGGATRSPCVTNSDKGLTAIMPVRNFGKTVSELPTLFVYIPPNKAQGAEIGIEDEQGNVIYKTTLKQEFASGIFSFALSRQPDVKPLALNKNYKWYFQLICNFNEQSRDDYVESWIQRVPVSDSLKTQLQQASVNPRSSRYRDRAEIYAQAGIWYETLENLALARRVHPNDSVLLKEWTDLLKQIKLIDLVGEPLH